MISHTPGPWKLEIEDQARIIGADGFCIAAIQIDDDIYGRPEEEMANARLMTAAPEMLTLLTKAKTELGKKGLLEVGVPLAQLHQDIDRLISKLENNK